MVQYGRFAEVYDLMNADQHSLKMVDYTFSILKRFKFDPRGARALELCCGTGSAIERLADAGLKMSGLDQSAEMLAIAARKLKGRRITLYKKSLPRFRLLDRNDSKQLVTFDLVTCFYDSLNYLSTEKKLGETFDTVARHLNSGGLFIFDLNTVEAFKNLWGENMYSGFRKDMAWIWRNEFVPEKKLANCHATFFVRKGKLWERFEETHTEYAYNNSVIRKLLKEAGLKVRGFYDCYHFTPPKRDTLRICVVAEKKG